MIKRSFIVALEDVGCKNLAVCQKAPVCGQLVLAGSQGSMQPLAPSIPSTEQGGKWAKPEWEILRFEITTREIIYQLLLWERQTQLWEINVLPV